ncbi:MBL fold metallo-hydrolase, partial [bacterium]|nr:MBL fold metallo-hydrolase [bacterium]
MRITTLVENTVFKAGLKAEHGLSFWIEYGEKKLLFDTGQTDLVLQNAQTLGIDLAQADAIVLSHGHYDHTGGLKQVLNIAGNSSVYFHPAAIQAKYHLKDGDIKEIGVTPEIRDILKDYVKRKKG